MAAIDRTQQVSTALARNAGHDLHRWGLRPGSVVVLHAGAAPGGQGADPGLALTEVARMAHRAHFAAVPSTTAGRYGLLSHSLAAWHPGNPAERVRVWTPHRGPSIGGLEAEPSPGCTAEQRLRVRSLLAVAQVGAVVPPGPCGGWGVPECWRVLWTWVRPLARPIPCRGAQGWWRLSAELDAQVREQMREQWGATL